MSYPVGPCYRAWPLLVLALELVACGDDTGSNDAGASAGTVAVGEPCRGQGDCAAVPGKEVECRCTDGASVPVCDLLREVGETCEITGNFQNECRSNAACTLADLGSDPVCVPKAPAGAACGSGDVVCAEPTVCQNATCVPGTLAMGEDCFTDAECLPDLQCDFFAGCAPRIPLGEACDGVPTARTCVDGAGCDGIEGRCVALKPDGADCFWDAECESGECVFDGCGHDHRIQSNVSFGCGFP